MIMFISSSIVYCTSSLYGTLVGYGEGFGDIWDTSCTTEKLDSSGVKPYIKILNRFECKCQESGTDSVLGESKEGATLSWWKRDF